MKKAKKKTVVKKTAVVSSSGGRCKSCDAMVVNRVLLGLVMLVPGLLKAFSIGMNNVALMLGSIGFPAPTLFAWILVIAEIGSGIAILARWNVEKVVWAPIVILLVATFTANWGNYGQMLIHLALVSNYALFAKRCSH